MEDILASIRRIIAEDEALFAAGEAARPDAPLADAPLADVPLADGEQADAVGPNEAPAPLASSQTAATAGEAFNALLASRFADKSEVVLAMTRDALQPMLAAWLDAHLPALVERLVKAEIERIARGG